MREVTMQAHVQAEILTAISDYCQHNDTAPVTLTIGHHGTSYFIELVAASHSILRLVMDWSEENKVKKFVTISVHDGKTVIS